ncbi:ABC transporter substrate-binding protein [Deinococcus rubellus]|uniref:ABC transporter substrate-binding protein n=1 Tax=Deinococcus rubellus TaxID=1889240 RepID=UPI0031F110A4
MNKLTLLALLALGSQSLAAQIVYGMGSEPTSLESGNVNDTGSALAQAQIYDTLVGFKDGTTTPQPGLALRWTANSDTTEWTFFLRQNVKFHDGTPFNADAALFNLNRWWDAADPNGYRSAGRDYQSWGRAFNGFKGDAKGTVKNIIKDGPYKIRFVLSKPYADFPQVIGSAFFGMASPTAIKKAGALYGTPQGGAVGTGPFTYQSWTSGDRLILKANPSYWRGPVKSDQLVMRFIKDPSARLNELKAGAIDFTADLNPDSLAAVRADSRLEAVLKPSFNVGFLSLNISNPYLKDVRVRQAIRLALNRKALVDGFWGELGSTDNSFLPPALSWANAKGVPTQTTYDPAAAKKLLADAGYPNGFSLDLWYMPVSRPYFPTPKPIAEAMAADLNNIGIKVSLKTEDWAAYLEHRFKPGFDMYMIGWTPGNGSPLDFYSAYYGADVSKDSNYTPPILDALILQAQATTSRPAQAKVYAQISQVTYDAAVRIPIVHSKPLAAKVKGLSGWVPSPLGTESFAGVLKP